MVELIKIEMNKKYICIKGVMELTGLARGTIYQYTSRNLIPYKKFGRLIRFEEPTIMEWMEQIINECN